MAKIWFIAHSLKIWWRYLAPCSLWPGSWRGEKKIGKRSKPISVKKRIRWAKWAQRGRGAGRLCFWSSNPPLGNKPVTNQSRRQLDQSKLTFSPALMHQLSGLLITFYRTWVEMQQEQECICCFCKKLLNLLEQKRVWVVSVFNRLKKQIDCSFWSREFGFGCWSWKAGTLFTV